MRLERPPEQGGQGYERDDAPHRGGGADSADARSGDDSIYAVDDLPDEIECGDGNDPVRKDAEDIATNCETVEIF